MKRFTLWLMLCMLFALPVAATAAPEVVANGLFYGKAVLTIDGKQELMTVGQSRHGVKLLEADEEHAVIEVDGQRRVLALDKSIAKEYSTPAEQKRHLQAKSHVIKAQLIHQTSSLATFEVEYYYQPAELGETVTLAAKTLYRNKDTGSWAHSYTKLAPGRNTVSISLSMNEKAPDSYLSDGVQFDLVSRKGDVRTFSGTLVFEFIKEWKR